MQHLIDQGHTHIALIGGPGDLQQVRDRRMGAEMARSRLTGLRSSSPSRHPTSTPRVGWQRPPSWRCCPGAERPTAVFAANDLLAIGALQGFVTNGLRVPEDMAIIGYDDVSYAASAAVPLSSIRQPRRKPGTSGR